MKRIGIIGGSGLDDPELFEQSESKAVSTRYGTPSAAACLGTIDGVEVVILARHGKEHTIPPSEVNYRANIQALRDLGCEAILSTTAVGSLREEIGRGDLVILDQFIDFTRRRINTFHERFEPGNPVHVSTADPFATELRGVLIESAGALGCSIHPRGTVVTIEGPRFSTRAESRMFRAWGADVINMTVATECALAVEAGIPYATVAMSTDYDCWKEDEAPVTWEEILEVFNRNAERVTRLLLRAVPGVAEG